MTAQWIGIFVIAVVFVLGLMSGMVGVVAKRMADRIDRLDEKIDRLHGGFAATRVEVARLAGARGK